MSEEAEAQESQEEAEPKEEKEAKPRPEGLPPDQEWDHVDFATASPDVIQRRFNRLYAQQKQNDGVIQKMAEDNRKLAERLESIVNQQEEDSTARRIDTLKAEKTKALEEGETARVVEIDDQILELRTKTKLEPKPEPKPEPEVGWFTPDKQAALQSWANETTEGGDLKRPWAQPGHPKEARCVEIANAVLNDPDFAGAPMNEILSEVDRLMAPRQRKPAQPSVLPGGSGPRETKKDSIKLSEDEKLVAQKMYPSLSRADAIERYGKSVASLRGNA